MQAPWPGERWSSYASQSRHIRDFRKSPDFHNIRMFGAAKHLDCSASSVVARKLSTKLSTLVPEVEIRSKLCEIWPVRLVGKFVFHAIFL